MGRAAEWSMTKRGPHIFISDTPTRINLGNMIQKLRRIRTELAQMTQQVDDALARIEGEPKS